jgi:hypothetical protein
VSPHIEPSGIGRTTSKEATMKRILVLLAIAAVGAAASVTTAQAAVIQNDTTSVGYAGFVPCANGGAGEILSGTIEMHNLVTSTVNGNHASWHFLTQPQGGNMVGAITGDRYRVTGVTRGTSGESLDSDHYTLTYVSSFQLIGPGPGNNLRVHETAHLTIDKNEQLIVQHDDLSIDCS